jgi:hypothetical protein
MAKRTVSEEKATITRQTDVTLSQTRSLQDNATANIRLSIVPKVRSSWSFAGLCRHVGGSIAGLFSW